MAGWCSYFIMPLPGTDNIPDLSDTEDRKVIIYPNPSRGFLNISIEDPTLEPQIIKIRDLYGNVVFTNSIEQGIKKCSNS